MGIYLNPGSSGFEEILRSEYVDKTGLIELVNQTIGTKRKLTCISRPRRFGKSFAAQMLCAYYDCTCDSRELFRDKTIAHADDYSEHLNQYHVICLDITAFISEVRKHVCLSCGDRSVSEGRGIAIRKRYCRCRVFAKKKVGFTRTDH